MEKRQDAAKTLSQLAEQTASYWLNSNMHLGLLQCIPIAMQGYEYQNKLTPIQLSPFPFMSLRLSIIDVTHLSFECSDQ